MARTGSGKTAAYLLPLLDHLKTHSAKVVWVWVRYDFRWYVGGCNNIVNRKPINFPLLLLVFKVIAYGFQFM